MKYWLVIYTMQFFDGHGTGEEGGRVKKVYIDKEGMEPILCQCLKKDVKNTLTMILSL